MSRPIPGASSWRWPSAQNPPKSKEPYLQRTVSVTDFHDDLAWCWKGSPPSPTESLISTASRSATPTNPWRSNPSSPKPSIKSPSAIWSEAGAPPEFSRCTTPVGPLKRPALASRSGSGSITPTLKEAPQSPTQTPTYSPEAEINATLEGDTIITPALASHLRLLFPNLLSRQGWERQSSQRAYGWALQNPKTAILFLACNDLTSWRRAVIFGLEDGMLPFKESDLDGVATDPKRVVKQQWRVLVKQLPMDGGIHEIENKQVLPLQMISLIRGRPAQTTDRVRWLGSQDQRIYVRKMVQCAHQSERSNALDQIKSLRRLKHPHILPMICAYSEGLNTAAITVAVDWDLEGFLNTPSNTRRPERLLGWINDLTQALAYIHTSELLHRNIRPTKVLVDNNHRILFSFFGLSTTPKTPSSPSPSQQYIYAAPEAIHRNKYSRSSDIFSLGCLFLDLLTAATQPTLDAPIAEFAAFRAASTANPLPAASDRSTDASFHAHLDRVHAWMKQLRTAIPTDGRDTLYLHQAMSFVAAMITPELAKRPKTKILAVYVGKWDEVRKAHGQRRRSESGGGMA